MFSVTTKEQKQVRRENKKRQRLRNFVGTQWLKPLIRGGSEKTEKESPELLDPQNQDWFEQQLENLSLRPDVRYLIYQIEHPNAGLPESERKEDGDSHYQFYVEFTKPIDMMKVV